jgi:hypothetical protein
MKKKPTTIQQKITESDDQPSLLNGAIEFIVFITLLVVIYCQLKL